MTERSSHSDRHIPNCTAFRTGTGLLKLAFATFDPPKLAAKHPAKHGQTLQSNANAARPQHHGPKLAGLASHFPHRSQPAPAASS